MTEEELIKLKIQLAEDMREKRQVDKVKLIRENTIREQSKDLEPYEKFW